MTIFALLKREGCKYKDFWHLLGYLGELGLVINSKDTEEYNKADENDDIEAEVVS